MAFPNLLSLSYTLLLISSTALAHNAAIRHLHPRYASGLIPQGCFSSVGNMQSEGTSTFQSSQACKNQCIGLKKSVIAMSSQGCWCGDAVPASSASVSTSECSTGCPGYPGEKCGGNGRWTVYTIGSSSGGGAPPSSNSGSSQSQSNAQVTKTVQKTIQGTVNPTVLTTVPPNSTASSNSAGGSGPSKAGIAAGVVVGVLVIIAAIAGMFIYFKRRKADDEGGHRRSSSVNAFVSKGTIGPTGLPARSSVLPFDTRLDPKLMIEKRNSAGSVFADNEDYSRRILRVANPDRGD